MTALESPGVYVHLPFCASRCSYCDFLSGFDPAAMPKYVEAVLHEATLTQKHPSNWKSATFDTLYLGGGTPSFLGATLLVKLLEGLRERLSSTTDCERTVECNPSDIHEELLDAMAKSGINRISLGVQSFVDSELALLSRRHDAKGAHRALKLIKQHDASFLINVDLIHAIPGQNLASLDFSLQQALEHKPDHLSCYALTLSQESPLAKRLAPRNQKDPDLTDLTNFKEEFATIDEAALLSHYISIEKHLESAGFEHYEISNYARDEHRSHHNQKYWKRVPVLALGAGAHGFDGKSRYENTDALTDYLESVNRDRLPVKQLEQLNAEQVRLEKIALGLRTSDGFHSSCLSSKGKTEEILQELIKEGLLLKDKNGQLRPTCKGMLLADGIALRLA